MASWPRAVSIAAVASQASALRLATTTRGAGGGEALGDGEADAPGAAGDDRGAAVEPEQVVDVDCHGPAPRGRRGPRPPRGCAIFVRPRPRGRPPTGCARGRGPRPGPRPSVHHGPMSVDLRSRTSEDVVAVDAATFFDQTLPALIEVLPHLPGPGATELARDRWRSRSTAGRGRCASTATASRWRGAPTTPWRSGCSTPGPRPTSCTTCARRWASSPAATSTSAPAARGLPRLVGGAAVAARRAAGARHR